MGQRPLPECARYGAAARARQGRRGGRGGRGDQYYDKAKAIEAYLRDSQNFKYSTTIPTPPTGMDRIDWFLFQSKEGYCEYYAGAMVVMLRTLGIPTRMAGGYAPGQYDERSQAYIVRRVVGAHLARGLLPRLWLDRVRAYAVAGGGEPPARNRRKHDRTDA